MTIRHLNSELDTANRNLKTCNTSITATKELNDDLENKREAVTKQRDTYKLRAANCYVQFANSQQTGAKPASGNGTITGTTDDFRDFAATCTNYWNERQLLEQSLAQCRSSSAQ